MGIRTKRGHAFQRARHASGDWHIRLVSITQNPEGVSLCGARGVIPWGVGEVSRSDEICALCLAEAVRQKVLHMPYRPSYAEPYSCSECASTGVKLWRRYQASPSNDLRCAACLDKELDDGQSFNSSGQRYASDGQLSDAVGWRVPAVPDEEGTGYWGYTSVPDAGVAWWRALPTYSR